MITTITLNAKPLIPRDLTILYAAGTTVHSNLIGNKRFRVVIKMNLQRYIDSPTRDDKTNVIKSIVWMLQEEIGARFLKKKLVKKHDKINGGTQKTAQYTLMTEEQARKKVGHTLRDLVILLRKEQKEGQEE